MASDPQGWPDPARPGYPANPERSGWHWLKHPEDLRPFPSPWNAELGGWPSGALHSPQGIIDLGFTYLGPCLPPAEIAAAVQAERESCAQYHDALVAYHTGVAKQLTGQNRESFEGYARQHREYAVDIRARGSADALAEALAQARREGAMAQREHIALIFEANDMTSTADEIRALPIRSAAGEDGK